VQVKMLFDFVTHLSCKHRLKVLITLLMCSTVGVGVTHVQGDHLSGKPGNVREFETCQGNVRDVVNSQGIVREMSGKKSCHGKVSQNCSLLDEYLHSYEYLVASS